MMRLLDGHPPERLAQIVVTALVHHLRGAVDGIGHGAQCLLDPVHEVVIVTIGEIQLEHGELGVVAGGQPFVAEVAVDFVDALEAADDEALQIQLRRDPQVHVHIERIVMRDEGLGRGAAGNRLHHGRLDFEEVERIQVTAQEADDPGAGHEDIAARFVDNEVNIALPIARLGVGQAVPLVRQRPQRLHQQAQAVDAHRQLVGLGAKQHPAGADDVADIPALEGVVEPRPAAPAAGTAGSGRCGRRSSRSWPCP